MKSEKWVKLCTVFIQAVLIVVVLGDPPDLYNCVDWDCEEWISKGKTLLRYNGKTERHLSFKQNQDIYILAKPVDPIYSDWLAKMGDKIGLVPKDMVREDKMGKAAKFKLMLGEIPSWSKGSETEPGDEPPAVEIEDVDDDTSDAVGSETASVAETVPTPASVEINEPSILQLQTVSEINDQANEPSPTATQVSPLIPPSVISEFPPGENFESIAAQEEEAVLTDIASDPVVDSLSLQLQPSTDTVLQGTTSIQYFSETPKTEEQKPTDNMTPRIPETISLENIASIQSASVAVEQESSTQLELESLSVSRVEKVSVVPEPETLFIPEQVQSVASSDALSQETAHEHVGEATVLPNIPAQDVAPLETAKEIAETMRLESTTPVPSVHDAQANDGYDDEEEDDAQAIAASNVEEIGSEEDEADLEEQDDVVVDADAVESKTGVPPPPTQDDPQQTISQSDVNQSEAAPELIHNIEIEITENESVAENSEARAEEGVAETEPVTHVPISPVEIVTDEGVTEPVSETPTTREIEPGADIAQHLEQVEAVTDKLLTEPLSETSKTPISEESTTNLPVIETGATTDGPVSESDVVTESGTKVAAEDSSEETAGDQSADLTSDFSFSSDSVRVREEHILSEITQLPASIAVQKTSEAAVAADQVATEPPVKTEEKMEPRQNEESVPLEVEGQAEEAERRTPPQQQELHEATEQGSEERGEVQLPAEPNVPQLQPELPELSPEPGQESTDSSEVPSESAENVENESGRTSEFASAGEEVVAGVEPPSHGHSHGDEHHDHDHHHHHHHRKLDQSANDTENPSSSIILVIKHLSSTLLAFLPEHLQDTILDVDDALVFTGIIALTLVSICVPYFLIEGYMSLRPLKRKVVELNKSLWKVSAAYETQQEEFEIFKQKAMSHDQFKKRAEQSENDVIILKKLEVKQREQIANLRAQLKTQMKEAVDIKALIQRTLEDKKIVEEQTGKYKEAYEEAKECLIKTKDDLNSFQTHAKSSALQLGVSSKNMEVLTAKIRLLQQEVEETKAHIASEIEKRKQVEADMVRIEESKSSVSQELADLKSICHQYESTVGDLNDEISRLESELGSLKESLGEDSPLVELAEVQANATFAEREAESLRTRLDGVSADNQIMKGKLEGTERLLEEAKEDRETTNNRLQVLETYFKEREETYLKTIEQLQQKESIRDKGKEELIKMIGEKDNICTDLTERLDTLKTEFEATKQQHRNETRGLEAKAHENWLSLCQAERKAQDARKDAELLRQRLTALSKEKDEDDVDGLNGPVGMFPLIPHELVPLPILDEPPSYFGLGDFIPPPPLDEEREPHRPPPLGGRLSPPFSDIDDQSILSPIGRRDDDECTDGSSGSEQSPRRSPIRGGNWLNVNHGDRDGDGGHGVMESTRRLSRPSATSSPIQHGVNL